MAGSELRYATWLDELFQVNPWKRIRRGVSPFFFFVASDLMIGIDLRLGFGMFFNHALRFSTIVFKCCDEMICSS